tara:strand:- start:110 stop:511 length:402 start_codon:yes stop_codon:yes gene_type:complete
MKKKKKNKPLKDHLEKNFFKSDKQLTLCPTDWMSKEKIDFQTKNLDVLQEDIVYEISEYAVDLKEDLLSEDGDEVEIIRAIVISRGMSEYFVCFDSFGQIRSFSSKIPRELISRICNSMNKTVRKGTAILKNE